MFTFLEFFAGGGMARAGLGERWQCLFANDFDPNKAAAYRQNWGDREIVVGDVAVLTPGSLPRSRADLAWASFPCQDLSLAGIGAGLNGSRSGSFWPFWHLIRSLKQENRAPGLVVLENVCGALTSRQGADFRALVEVLRQEGYRCGALIIDAAFFLPQSRPRLFIVAADNRFDIDPKLLLNSAQGPFHSAALRGAYASLPIAERKNWLWWNLSLPLRRQTVLSEVIDDTPSGVEWHTAAQTSKLLEMMTPVNLKKVEKARRMKRRVVGSLYKRTRPDENGVKIQRAEVRFDDIAGCLRTPNGGSSRQTILLVQDGVIKSRLLSPRETARLMGLPDDYELPVNYNEAYHLMGDGVAVPVVRHLASNILEPLLSGTRLAIDTAA